METVCFTCACVYVQLLFYPSYASLHFLLTFILCTVSNTGELNVLLKEGSRSTTLWWLSGSHGDRWQHGTVTLGGVPQGFTVLFEASRTFNNPGHIAIDDIAFTNCSLPGRVPALTQHIFIVFLFVLFFS